MNDEEIEARALAELAGVTFPNDLVEPARRKPKDEWLEDLEKRPPPGRYQE